MEHPCPPGQDCVVGVCNGSAGGPGVFCGSAGTCTTGTKCCSNAVGSPSCIPVADSCSTGSAAECDGSADCGAERCCDGTDGPVCMPDTACTPEICLDQSECDGGMNCCHVDPTVTW